MSSPTADVSARVAWVDDAEAIAAVQAKAWRAMYAGVLPAEAFDPRPEQAHANWWWGITPSALRGMLESVGFEVVEERRGRGWPFAVEMVARAA